MEKHEKNEREEEEDLVKSLENTEKNIQITTQQKRKYTEIEENQEEGTNNEKKPQLTSKETTINEPQLTRKENWREKTEITEITNIKEQPEIAEKPEILNKQKTSKLKIKLKQPTLNDIYEKKNQNKPDPNLPKASPETSGGLGDATRVELKAPSHNPPPPSPGTSQGKTIEKKKITEYFIRKENQHIPGEKKISSNISKIPNQPSPSRPRTKPKPALSQKKRKNEKNESKTVTQLRGFWTKFAEEQKQKRKNEEENCTQQARIPVKRKIQESMAAPESTVPDLASSKLATNSCTLGSDNPNVPEHSKRPDRARIKIKMKRETNYNYSGDSTKNRISD